MLSNFETPRSKLMQIILAGQPSLADKLARPEFEQLRQRVSIFCRLEPFTKEQVGHYVQHRLEAAGYKGAPLFTPEAISIIAEQSRGIPRNINNLCFHALSLGYAKELKKIDHSVLEEVLADLDLDSLRTRRSEPSKDRPQEQNARFDLGSVNLGGGSRADAERNRLYGGIHSLPPSHGANGHRRKPPTQSSSRWLIWAVVLPAIILVGEVFWAYLPSSSSREAVNKSVAAAVQEAKTIAVKHNLLKSSGASATQAVTKPPRNPADSNNEDPSQTRQVGSSATATPVVADPGKGPSAAPSDGNAVDPVGNSEPPTTTLDPSTTVQKQDEKTSSRYTPEESDPSADAVKAKVVIESNIGSGQITINGKTQPDWQTPHIFSLPVGSYRISVSKAGYSTWFHDVEVTEGSKKWVMANLSLPRGVIVIDTDPPGMQVFIDGKPYGPSEVETALTAGTHSYEVIPSTGHQPISGSFVLKPGGILTKKISLLPSAGRPGAENRTDPSLSEREGNAMRGGNKS